MVEVLLDRETIRRRNSAQSFICPLGPDETSAYSMVEMRGSRRWLIFPLSDVLDRSQEIAPTISFDLLQNHEIGLLTCYGQLRGTWTGDFYQCIHR